MEPAVREDLRGNINNMRDRETMSHVHKSLAKWLSHTALGAVHTHTLTHTNTLTHTHRRVHTQI